MHGRDSRTYVAWKLIWSTMFRHVCFHVFMFRYVSLLSLSCMGQTYMLVTVFVPFKLYVFFGKNKTLVSSCFSMFGQSDVSLNGSACTWGLIMLFLDSTSWQLRESQCVTMTILGPGTWTPLETHAEGHSFTGWTIWNIDHWRPQDKVPQFVMLRNNKNIAMWLDGSCEVPHVQPASSIHGCSNRCKQLSVPQSGCKLATTGAAFALGLQLRMHGLHNPRPGGSKVSRLPRFQVF